ncbi:MAG TPA: serine hydrolase, partial [Saprospiraceae bacterium]|nr:serine hydrolase [Saprospiraceae bacterium]
MKFIFLIFSFWIFLSLVPSTFMREIPIPLSDSPIDKSIKKPSKNHPIFDDVELSSTLNNPKYEIQIRYTQIDRDSLQKPIFTTYTWNENENYFYPASTVKMPVAFAALEKFNEIKKINPCLSIYDPFIAGLGQKPQTVDTLHPYTSQKPSLAEHIRLIFSVSDNNAYNRLFEFTGQDYINTLHRNKNIFTNSHIIHRV